MLRSCWSVKGGVGTSVVTALVALQLARQRPTWLVDLVGDLDGVLGVAEPAGPGVSDWLGSEAELDWETLTRLATPVAPNLGLVHRGGGDLGSRSRVEPLAELLADDHHDVVVDCGVVVGDHVDVDGPAPVLAKTATLSLLVLRRCSLALRRARDLPVTPSGVVLVDEPGRALRRRDVESVVGAPIRAQIPFDPALARMIDAGSLAARPPRGALRCVRSVA